MTTWTPEFGTLTIPETIEEKTVTGLINPPPVGTRIRATLGETVLTGKIQKHSPYEMFYIALDQPESADGSYEHTLEVDVWVGAGWTFELLDGEVTA